MLSRTGPGSRRVGWETRARCAQRRFVLYTSVENEINQERSQGGKPLEMVWKLPNDKIRALFQAGGQVLRAFGRKAPSEVPHEQIEHLERLVERLATADDWSRRLQTFLQRLRNERARVALTKLVRLGCVPHDLVRSVQSYADQRAVGVVEKARDETQTYLPRLWELVKLLEQVANACERYTALRENYGGSKFYLDRNIAWFLRDEATAMQEFIRDSDPRRHGRRTKADVQLFLIMREIKTITGGFQDRLVADFLNGVPGIRTRNAEMLKRWRARQDVRWNEWKPSRYVTRPVSRIETDVELK